MTIQMTADDLRDLPECTGELYYPDGETALPNDIVLDVDVDGGNVTYFADGWDCCVEFGPVDNSPDLARRCGL